MQLMKHNTQIYWNKFWILMNGILQDIKQHRLHCPIQFYYQSSSIWFQFLTRHYVGSNLKLIYQESKYSIHQLSKMHLQQKKPCWISAIKLMVWSPISSIHANSMIHVTSKITLCFNNLFIEIKSVMSSR